MSNWLNSQTARDIFFSIAVFVGAAVAAAILRVFLLPLFRRITSRTKTDVDDVIVRALQRPLVLLILLAGTWAALRNPHYWAATSFQLVDKVAAAAAVLVLLYGALRVFDAVAAVWTEAVVEKSPRPREIRAQAIVGRKVVNITILVVGILIILRQLGLDIGPLLAGLGLGGLAVALALQDTLSNLFAGIYMMVDRPITVGDFVKLESGEEGFIEEIGWRNTKVRMWANNIVIIPNAKLSQSVLTNYYLPRQEMSVYIRCGVAYDSDLEHVERVCIEVGKEVMAGIPGSAKDWTPVVRFKEFADFSINFLVVLRVEDFGAQYVLAHEYMKALHRRFGQEGIEIPFPIQTVIIRQPKPRARVTGLEARPAGTPEVGEGESPSDSGEGE